MKSKMKNISEVKSKCVGCRSCEQICPSKAIVMAENNEGFLYPVINNKCIECSACVVHCPALAAEDRIKKPRAAYALQNIGYPQAVQSASGGVAFLTAQYIVDNGGVVYGAAYDANLNVKHIRITDTSDISKIQSSKYVQSDTGDTYVQVRNDLKNNKVVLYTGTPCQIAGLYKFLKINYENLYTIDIICHGVPSPKFLKKYIEYQTRKLDDEIKSINFRSKKRGWGTQYLLEISTAHKSYITPLALDKYGSHFVCADCFRESCYQCRYAKEERIGDITVGDFWGVLKLYPKFYSELGVSTVIVNSAKGEQLFNKIKINTDNIEITLSDTKEKQGNLIGPTQRPISRDQFYKDIDKDGFVNKIKIKHPVKEYIKSWIPMKLYVFLKTKM